ncbi:DUF2889 domain-containing protein [Streptomyces sp. NPDC001255]|uniref:DUF2889 domain-containing protein n=1 Tax=Streptomyces sp. NPDC001255 TaxID=3364550 RepID=UPI0036B62D5D
MTPEPRWDQGVRILATGRDLVTRADGSAATVGEARIEVRVDGTATVTEALLPRTPHLAPRLVGVRAASGFRSGTVAPLVAEGGLTSLEAALLDDVPVTRLISGYAMLRAVQAGRLPAPTRPKGRSAAPPLNVCVGWAPGATADTRARAGEIVLGPPVPAPGPGAPVAGVQDWHDEPPGSEDTMYRRRLLDLRPEDTGTAIECYLRDSWVDALGQESALHEYTVEGRAEGAPAVLAALDSRPHTLPFPECPLAARSADSLVGTPLAALDRRVRELVGGPQGCTHLADTLRSMRFTEELLGHLG